MLIADLELIDPGAGPACTNAQAKAGQLIIEEIASDLPLGRARAETVFCVSFMGGRRLWEDPYAPQVPAGPYSRLMM
jgi:hypothetical protein